MTDRDLLLKYLRGDEAAFEDLVRRHIDMVYAAARRQVGPVAADDITQAVFIMLTRKAKSLRQRESLAGWLYRVTGYCCFNLSKTESRRRKHERESAMLTPPHPQPPEDLPEVRDLLDAALARLSERDREIILLHHLQQKSHAETAACLGITEEAARKRADRSLEKLRTLFARQGHTIPAASIAAALASHAAIKATPAILSSTLAVAKASAIPAALSVLTKSAGKLLFWSNVKVAAMIVGGVVIVGAAVSIPFLMSRAPAKPAAEQIALDIAPDEIAGRILDESGNPVPDVTVSFPTNISTSPNYFPPISTAANGVFRFPHVGKSWFMYMQVEKEGYATQWLPDVTQGKPNEIHLDRSTRVKGIVVLPDRRPAANAYLTFVTTKVSARTNLSPLGNLQLSTVTDAQGHFDLPLEPNEYELRANNGDGYFARIYGIKVEPARTAEQSVTLAPGIHIQIRTIDSVTHKPIPNVELFIENRLPGAVIDEPGTKRRTDYDGIAEWNSAMPGPQRLSITAAGYAVFSSPNADNPNTFTKNDLLFNFKPDMPEIVINLAQQPPASASAAN